MDLHDNTITTERFASAMKRVPEKNLRIISLANLLVGPDGKFDYTRVQDMQAEVNLARAEAQSYCTDANLAVNALKKLKPRGNR